jgi:hypothetical protein
MCHYMSRSLSTWYFAVCRLLHVGVDLLASRHDLQKHGTAARSVPGETGRAKGGAELRVDVQQKAVGAARKGRRRRQVELSHEPGVVVLVSVLKRRSSVELCHGTSSSYRWPGFLTVPGVIPGNRNGSPVTCTRPGTAWREPVVMTPRRARDRPNREGAGKPRGRVANELARPTVRDSRRPGHTGDRVHRRNRR